MYHLQAEDELRQRCTSHDSDGTNIQSITHQERIVPLSHRHHVRGWHPVRPGHVSIAFESKLEASIISALANYKELVEIESQPITVRYSYFGITRRYTPDLLVTFSEVPVALARLGFKKKTYVEVKPLVRAMSLIKKLRLQFAVIRKATALPIVLLTDSDLVDLLVGAP